METTTFWGEFIGTMILILFGGGVNANTSLKSTYGNNAGWIVTTTGWAFAVMIAIFVAQKFGSSEAHLNPAVTVALASYSGDFSNVFTFILAQITGAAFGATLVWLIYLPHWAATADAGVKLGVFSTGPAIVNNRANFFTEVIATFGFVVGVMAIYAQPDSGLKPFLLGAVVWGVGLSLGGSTGYAINPARDLGPRIAHQLLPIAGKGSSNWGYAWIPVLGPLVGSVLAAFFYRCFGV